MIRCAATLLNVTAPGWLNIGNPAPWAGLCRLVALNGIRRDAQQVLRYIAAGLPVVSSAAGELKDLILQSESRDVFHERSVQSGSRPAELCKDPKRLKAWPHAPHALPADSARNVWTRLRTLRRTMASAVRYACVSRPDNHKYPPERPGFDDPKAPKANDTGIRAHRVKKPRWRCCIDICHPPTCGSRRRILCAALRRRLAYDASGSGPCSRDRGQRRRAGMLKVCPTRSSVGAVFTSPTMSHQTRLIGLDGSLVECGVAQGGSAALMDWSNKSGQPRMLWLSIDEGLPEPTSDDFVAGATVRISAPFLVAPALEQSSRSPTCCSMASSFAATVSAS